MLGMSEPVLSVKDLRVHYGVIEALRGVSLEVPEGKVVALIGANGAGKTTTLRAISRMLRPSAGSVRFKGEELTRLMPHDISAQGVALLLVEQNAHKALQIAHHAYVLETGEVVMQGSGSELLASPEVRKAYLGE